jgi:hypothetical protein
VVNVSSLLKHTLDARKSARTDPHRDAIVGNGATDAFQNHGHPCDAAPVPLSSDKILPRDVGVGGFQRGRADHAIRLQITLTVSPSFKSRPTALFAR